MRHVRALTPPPRLQCLQSEVQLHLLDSAERSVTEASNMPPLIHYFHKGLTVASFGDFPGVGERSHGAPAGPQPASADPHRTTYGTQSCIVNILAAVTQQSRKLRTRGENGPSWTGRLSVREINEQDPENTQWGPLLNFSKR